MIIKITYHRSALMELFSYTCLVEEGVIHSHPPPPEKSISIHDIKVKLRPVLDFNKNKN